MPEKELREKYGGKLAKAINRAIRAEVEGGNAALDSLTRLSGPAAHSGWLHPNGQPTDEAVAFEKQQRVVTRMENEVRQKYGLPPAQPPKIGPGKPRASRPKSKGKAAARSKRGGGPKG
jgi:hypothetical protein